MTTVTFRHQQTQLSSNLISYDYQPFSDPSLPPHLYNQGSNYNIYLRFETTPELEKFLHNHLVRNRLQKIEEIEIFDDGKIISFSQAYIEKERGLFELYLLGIKN